HGGAGGGERLRGVDVVRAAGGPHAAVAGSAGPTGPDRASRPVLPARGVLRGVPDPGTLRDRAAPPGRLGPVRPDPDAARVPGEGRAGGVPGGGGPPRPPR